jgi:hypothetical protein
MALMVAQEAAADRLPEMDIQRLAALEPKVIQVVEQDTEMMPEMVSM